MKGIDRTPWLYDLFMAWGERGRLRRWRAWLAGGARGRVLELGCGTGRNLVHYAPGARVVAIEPWLPSLARARRRAPDALLVAASAEALPFRDGAFDTVVASLVLCSVGSPAAALGEARRVLAPGGALRAVEHVRARRAWAARLQDAGQPIWTWLAGGCHPNRDTERAVEEAGFRIVEDGRRARGVMRRFAATAPPGTRRPPA
jgi:ubiquinone/menaquinone biosynthesis C-methylase UbiE